MREPVPPVHAHIGVVVARHEADPARVAEGLEPGGGGGELVPRGDIHDVARQRHMVGAAATMSAAMAEAAAMECTRCRLRRQLNTPIVRFSAKCRRAEPTGRGPEVQVREMGEGEYRHVVPLGPALAGAGC